MINRHLVVVFEEFSEISPEDADIYDIALAWLQGYPNQLKGVYVEEWYVKTGDNPLSHPANGAHESLNRTVKVVDWSELNLSPMVKLPAWWMERKKILNLLYTIMKQTTKLAIDLSNDVAEIIDPDQETLEAAMQGTSEWLNYDTLGHWLEMTEKTLEEYGNL